MQILTAAEMGEADRRTAERFGVSMAELMENAGTAVARFCLRQCPGAKRVVVLCGKGNNGGDGMVAARVLAGAGRAVTVLLLGWEDDVRGEAAKALARMRDAAETVELLEVGEDTELTKALGKPDLIVDAMVGTGFKPPLRGVAAMLRDIVSGLEVPVVAVDLPSGWDADSIEQEAKGAVRADAVVTFTRPKRAHVFGHLTGTVFGPVVVAEIGSPAGAVFSAGELTWTGASKAIAETPRGVNANKGKFGHVLVIGGSYGTAGAPSMASLAALRTGAGLVTAAVPKSVVDSVGRVTPELMVKELQGVGNREQGVEEQAWAELLKGITVVGIGPGLGQAGTTPEFVRGFVARTPAGKEGKPVAMVIDADALNAFAEKAELLNGEGRVMVLTPHPGEMARLAGMTIPEVEADRIGLARRFATEHKLTLVLKGWRTLVAHPDGRIAVNTTGNPAMAKGGSGDILTGIVAAMLAQYAGSGAPDDVASAVEAAVYLHGLAGDFAAHAMDEHTVLATDTLAHLSDAFRYRVKDADGLTWLCGLHGQGTR
jgi:NAD(P)H-hydrate epimerase